MNARSPLHDWHASHDAKFTPFAGWEMPLSYPSGSIAEHRSVRASAGLFDVSHMAEFEVEGGDATAVLNGIVTANLESVADWSSTYALICEEDGGVLDDLYLYRMPDRWFIVANAANRESDAAWFRSHIDPARGEVRFTDRTDKIAMFALQGPRAMEVADGLATELRGIVPTRIPRFGMAADGEIRVGRTGYTGEDGIEIFASSESALSLWELILRRGSELEIEIGPIGLAARDSLRFEPGFALYGHELQREITPLEARLAWACDLEKPFIGRDALIRQKEQGLTKRLATVRLNERGVPREGQPVVLNDERVGEVVSGLYSPTLDGFYANAYLPPALAKTGTEVDIEIRGRRKAAQVVKRPLYTPAYR